jgi:hypothetical protein
MLEIGTSGLMSGEEKRVVILLLGDLIPRSFSTLPNFRTGALSPFCETNVRPKGADYQWVEVPLQELSV